MSDELENAFERRIDELLAQKEADTIAKVVRWLEQSAARMRYERHREFTRGLASALRDHPEVLDQP